MLCILYITAVGTLLGVVGVLIERTLLQHDRVWIGAGSEHHMAGLAPVDLARLTHAVTADLT